MFPLTLTAEQAVASCLNGRVFKLESRGNANRSIREIWREDGLIKAQQYWSQYGWITETLREDTKICVLKKYPDIMPPIKSSKAPTTSHIQARPNRTSYLFSPAHSPHELQPIPKRVSKNIAITAMIIFETFLEYMGGNQKREFATKVQNWLDDNGVFSLREYCLSLAPVLDEAYIIANAGELYRCSNLAWDFDFVPTFLKIALDDDLAVKSNWKQIANALGQYYAGPASKPAPGINLSQ